MTTQRSTGAIVPPDPAVRTAAIVMVAAGLIAGLFLVAFVRQYMAGLETLIQTDPDEASRRIGAALTVLAWAAAVPPLAAAAALVNVALRAWRSERYPPPGARPIRPIRLRTGPAARRIAATAGLLAAVLVVATAVLIVSLRGIEQWLINAGGI